jgi:hypothetical protein
MRWPSPNQGCEQTAQTPQLVAAQAEIARLSEELKEMGVRLMLMEGYVGDGCQEACSSI